MAMDERGWAPGIRFEEENAMAGWTCKPCSELRERIKRSTEVFAGVVDAGGHIWQYRIQYDDWVARCRLTTQDDPVAWGKTQVEHKDEVKEPAP